LNLDFLSWPEKREADSVFIPFTMHDKITDMQKIPPAVPVIDGCFIVISVA